MEALVSDARGREGRLKPEYADLYPGLTPDTWMPVEALLRHIATLLYSRHVEPSEITGARLIREEHFESRGHSDRPDGLPPNLSRLSDASAKPVPRKPSGNR